MNTKQDLLENFKESYKLEEGNRKHKQALYKLDKNTGSVSSVEEALLISNFGADYTDNTTIQNTIHNAGIYPIYAPTFYEKYFQYLIDKDVLDTYNTDVVELKTNTYPYICQNGVKNWGLEACEIGRNSMICVNANNGAILVPLHSAFPTRVYLTGLDLEFFDAGGMHEPDFMKLTSSMKRTFDKFLNLSYSEINKTVIHAYYENTLLDLFKECFNIKIKN